jgi:hypothetical protein
MKSGQRIAGYLRSPKNIAGTALGALGLVGAAVAGLLGIYWAPIALGLYGVGALIAPRGEREEVVHKHEVTVEDIEERLLLLQSRIRRKVGYDIYKRVDSIGDTIRMLLPSIDNINAGDYDLFNLRQTALDYLPEMLEEYLALSREYRTEAIVQDGKTAKDLLIEQLDILDREMREIAGEVSGESAQRLIAHGRFLEEKFDEPSTDSEF